MIVALLLALLFLALPAIAPTAAAGFSGVPRTAAILMPLLLAAGLPCRARGSGLGTRGSGRWTRAVGLLAAAPTVALAARLDSARGDLDAAALAAGLVMLVLLALAASRGETAAPGARSDPRAAAWLFVVLLGPLLALAYAWGTREPHGPAWVEAWRALSPVAWAWDRAALVPRSAWAPLGASAALGALALLPTGASGESRAGSASATESDA